MLHRHDSWIASTSSPRGPSDGRISFRSRCSIRRTCKPRARACTAIAPRVRAFPPARCHASVAWRLSRWHGGPPAGSRAPRAGRTRVSSRAHGGRLPTGRREPTRGALPGRSILRTPRTPRASPPRCLERRGTALARPGEPMRRLRTESSCERPPRHSIGYRSCLERPVGRQSPRGSRHGPAHPNLVSVRSPMENHCEYR